MPTLPPSLRPAQAFALAPLFVWYELLFLLGYRPALRAALAQRVAKDVAAWKRAQSKKAG